MTKTQLIDLGERAGWTLAQAAVAFGITEATGLKTWWALPLATALSAVKTWVQHKLAAKQAA
jgi:hypothetical protein